MCGLVGVFGSLDPKTIVQSMNDKIVHRGPDGDGYWHILR